MGSALSFLTELGNGISVGAVAFWNDVLVPLGAGFSSWAGKYIPFCGKFADFCMSLFKFRYMGRVYSFALVAPIALFFLILFIIRSRVNRSRRRRRARKAAKKR